MVFATCKSNEVMVVSGVGLYRPKKISGRRTWYWSCCQEVQRIPVQQITVSFESLKVPTCQEGVSISLVGELLVFVQVHNEEMFDVACEEFLGKTEEAIEDAVSEIMDKHHRLIMATMTVEDINKDHKKFCKAMYKAAIDDLIYKGLSCLFYTLKDIQSEEAAVSDLVHISDDALRYTFEDYRKESSK